jgi:hypothetical protein
VGAGVPDLRFTPSARVDVVSMDVPTGNAGLVLVRLIVVVGVVWALVLL